MNNIFIWISLLLGMLNLMVLGLSMISPWFSMFIELKVHDEVIHKTYFFFFFGLLKITNDPFTVHVDNWLDYHGAAAMTSFFASELLLVLVALLQVALL